MGVKRRPPPSSTASPTRIFMVCPRDAATGSPRCSAPPWPSARWSTESLSIIGKRYHAGCGTFHRISGIAGVRRYACAEGGHKSLRRSRFVEELHLHARDLDEVVVAEGMGLRAQRRPVQRGIGGALHVGDEVSVR